MTPEGNMIDDELIEWLLDWGRIGEEPVLIEAASRIKKLRAALREIAALGYWDGDSAMNIARKALDAK